MMKTHISLLLDDVVIKEVKEFIQRRFHADNNWCSGNCYWFAEILVKRFPGLDIYIFPIENHFMAGDGKIFFDWNGERRLKDCCEKPLLWSKCREFDSEWYDRIVKFCIL